MLKFSSIPTLLLLMLLGAGCSVDSAKSRYVLAEKLWDDGNYAAAVAEFDKVISKDPNGKLGTQALYRSAMIQSLYLSQHNDAIRKLKSIITANETSPLAWESQKQIGEILFTRTEQFDQAIQHYRTLIKKKPDSIDLPEFLYRIAKSQFFLWQFEEAVQTYKEIVKILPDSSWAEKALYEIGVAYYTRGEQNPGNTGPGIETYQEAIDAFQSFIRKYPQSSYIPQAKFGIASCLEEMDQLDAAYHQYEELKDTFPSPNVIQIKLIRIKERKAQRSR